MSKFKYYTKEGLDKLKSELNDLKTRGRSDISKAIAEARDKGDLSENAEYDAAKDAQGHLEARISQLEKVVGDAREIDESSIDDSKVGILTEVKIKNLGNGMEFAYTLVSEEEADLKQKKISTMSPIGSGLMGKKVGDTAEITTPGGKMKFKILEISIGV